MKSRLLLSLDVFSAATASALEAENAFNLSMERLATLSSKNTLFRSYSPYEKQCSLTLSSKQAEMHMNEQKKNINCNTVVITTKKCAPANHQIKKR